jgi:hypothetical protein
MSERLVTILSGLLILTSAALSVVRPRTAESGEGWNHGASIESELPVAGRGNRKPLTSPPEETLEKLFNRPPAASGPSHPAAAASATESEGPSIEPEEPPHPGRKVGYLRLAGGKAMIFVRR